MRTSVNVLLSFILASRIISLAARASDPVHPPIAIPFKLREPAFVTLVIEDSEGKRVRNLLAETEFPAGENIAYWDGLDDLGRDPDANAHSVYYIPGKLVAPGRYIVRGLSRPKIDLRYQFSVYNHANPPWHTGDRSSEWLANHTPPFAVLYVPEENAPVREGRPAPGGQIIVGSLVSEGGSGVAWLDLAGNKLHGQLWIGGVWTGASQLARDEGDHPVPGVYAYTGSAWDDELRLYELVSKPDKANAPRDQRFGTGEDRPVLTPKWKFPKGTKFHDRLAQPGLSGLAVRDGLLVAALPTLNEILFVDARARKEIGAHPLNDPRGVYFERDGSLLALSGTQLLRFDPAPAGLPLPNPKVLVNIGLEDPKQLALDSEGRIYVSDWGSSHQVKVYARDGKFLRAIGEAGRPKAGPYNARHMNHPNGISISVDGKLWVAESDVGPKRVSVWSLDGTFLNAFYGPPQYGGGGELDPQDKSLFHFASQYTGFGDAQSGLTMKLDSQKRTFEITDVYYRSDDDPSRLPTRTFVSLAPQTPIYFKNRKYFTSTFSTSPTGGAEVGVLWTLENGVAVARAALGQARSWGLLKTDDSFRSRVPDGVKLEDATFAWSDLNGNGIAEAAEVMVHPGRAGASIKVDRELGMTTANGKRFLPVKFTKEGAPVYDLDSPEVLVTGTQSPVSSGGGEALVGSKGSGWTIFTTAPKPFSPYGIGGVKDGVAMWSYPSLWPGLHASHGAPMPELPGELIGTTRIIGFPIHPRGSDAGDLWAINGNKGNVYLFTMDGLFVATLFRDCREKLWDFPREEPGMLVNDASLQEESFWPFLSQTKDGDIWLTAHNACIVKVEGLEKIRRLPNQEIPVSAKQLQAARDWFVHSEARRQAAMANDADSFPIAMKAVPPDLDGRLDDWATNLFITIDTRMQQDGDWGKRRLRTEAALAVNDGRLFAAFRTWDSKLLRNHGDSLPLLFKTGGALDLMFDSVPGGERLLVTQVEGRTTAVLYRPIAPGTKSEPVAFSSPIRTLKFDRVEDVSDHVSLAVGTNGIFELSVPLELLHLDPKEGATLKGDVGVLRGNGSQTMQRAYWRNKSAGLVSDIPSEAELAPRLWGKMEFKRQP